MRGRFGRRRRGGAREPQGAALDASRELARLGERGIVSLTELAPLETEGVPADFAVLGRGEGAGGRATLVAWSPRSGGDAWLAGVATALRLARSEGFAGEVLAISPFWPTPARRRLSLLGEVPFRVRGVVEPEGADAPATVQAEAVRRPQPARPEQCLAGLRRPERRELADRVVGGLRGLAAKHGGTLRASAAGCELALGGRVLARLERSGDQLTLHAELPRRTSLRIEPESLADALDRLEGAMRKFLNDRKIRDGQEGLRTRLLPLLASAAGVAEPPLRWPTPGADSDPLDFLAVDGEGRVVVGASRGELTLPELGTILDAWGEIAPLAGSLLVESGCTPEPPRLLVAAEVLGPLVAPLLAVLRMPCAAYEVRRAGRELRLASRPLEEETIPVAPSAPVARAAPAAEAAPTEPEAPTPRFEEVSVFELADEERQEEGDAAAAGGRRRRRRGRGRRGRGRRPSPREAAVGDSRAREERPQADRPPLDDEEEDEAEIEAKREAEAEAVAELVDTSEPEYEDEEEIEETAEERIRAEREARRRARMAKSEPEPEPEPEPARKMPRKRAAILAHADRESLGAALVLARDLRLVEGIWIYPQADLMTFFRGVATDLREGTPIYVVGFTASPARDVLQAASLYRERLWWFDHHAWPPEDLEGLRAAVGGDAVHVEPGLGSPLPLVLELCTRRSRFTDKLVDLLTGRFTRHDWERWGRVWWHRLGELTGSSGEQRARLDPLLAGRPSDLARAAARMDLPPPPPELAFVAERDFRVVHFGGYTLVRLPLPEQLDPSLAGRIARARYDAQLALAWHEGGDRLILTGEDLPGRRSLDLGAMVSHLASKFDWVEALSDADHVARIRVLGLGEHPERLEEIVNEISMSRSILEG